MVFAAEKDGCVIKNNLKSQNRQTNLEIVYGCLDQWKINPAPALLRKDYRALTHIAID